MKTIPQFKIPFWRRMLSKMNLYAIKDQDKFTTIVVEVENATGAIAINKIQDIPIQTALDVFARIIKLSK